MLLPLCLALALVWAAAVHGPALARTDADNGRRLALIVGNSQYESVYSLKNAVNDADAMAEMLGRLGFEVTILQNARHEQFETTIDNFAKDAEGAEAAVFFYAGHGFQLGGANYLVPSDAGLKSRDAIEKETLRLDSIIARLQARNRQTLIFLDACRNNPLPESVRGQNAGDGLAQVETGTGTFVAFATQPGNITVDGQGDNSPFTLALLEHIDTPGISISDLMIRVRNSVEERTLQQQTPWDQSSLRSQFYFNPEGEGSEALTDDDRELLMSLDPELREKFAQRFGLKIESVDDEAADEPLIPVITAAVSIETMAEEPAAPAPEPAVPTAMLSISAAEEPAAPEEPSMPDQAPLPMARPDPAPQATPAEDEVQMAAVDPDAGRTRAPASVDPVRIPGAAARTPSTVTGIRPALSETGASAARPETEMAALPTPESPTLRFSPPEFGTAGRVTKPDGTAVDALDDLKRVPTQSGTAVSLNPVASDHRRVLGQEVAPEAPQTEVAALQPAAEAANDATNEAASDTPIAPAGAATLTPAPQEPAAPAAQPDTKLAALDPAQIRPDPVPVPAVEEEKADLPDDLPRAIQAELSRLGCYRSGIDGIWGSGSARALLRYYATKKESPDDLEPNARLYARLTAEDKVVCTFTEAAKPQATTPRRQRENATPVRQEPAARRQVPAPSASTQSKPSAPRRAEAAPDGSGKRTLRRTLGTGTFR